MRVKMIYLAAGNSRRFGSYEVRDEKTRETKKYTNKLLYDLEGKPMYLHLLERLVKICERHSEWEVLVVTRHQEIYASVRERESKGKPVHPVWSADSEKGISHSVRAGVLAAKRPEGCEGEGPHQAEACAFFVADQPHLTEESAEEFLMEMEKTRAPLGSVRCGNQDGSPTWFSRMYFEELMKLSGDQGGRKVLRKYPGEVRYFEIEDRKELQDIDYYGDEKVQNLFATGLHKPPNGV